MQDIHTKIKLSELLRQAGDGIVLSSGIKDYEIISIEYDSRKVSAGCLFVAIEGFSSDGHAFVGDAFDRGAAAVVVNESRRGEYSQLEAEGKLILGFPDTREALALLSAAYYQNPSRDMTIIGVTGTNGKTSITYMLEKIAEKAGLKPGVIGTINYRWRDQCFTAPNTTPESKDLQQILALMVHGGVDIVIMEVSSHGLELKRAHGVAFDAVVFTNLTAEHLDFHGDIEAYFNAKKILFDLLDKSPKQKKTAVINGDDDYGSRLLAELNPVGYTISSYGFSQNMQFMVKSGSVRSSIQGIEYALEKPEDEIEIRLKLAGNFHVYNSLAALAAAAAVGVSYENIVAGLGEVTKVPGRFDVVSSDAGASVVVDYAHTGDALLKLLQSVRELAPQRVITVFGCGGDRDKAKRPVMGSVAAEYSDMVIVTSDNPRTEDPMEIINNILTGIKRTDYTVEPDREKAIALAIASAQKGDIVVIAGKGHEDYQILGTKKIHFDDRETASKYINRRQVG